MKECTKMPSMFEERCYAGGGMIDAEKIIVFGGYNGEDRLCSAELFDIPSNSWRRIADMDNIR